MAERTQVPDVGARIKEARESIGLTQLEFADALGLGAKGHGQRTLQAWERNERTPRLDSLIHLARLTDRPVSWFYEPPMEEAA